jgi:hypothetical protein
MFEDGFGLGLCYYRRQGGYIGLLDGLQAAEVFEQAAGSGFAYARDFSQFGGAVADLAALAVAKRWASPEVICTGWFTELLP